LRSWRSWRAIAPAATVLGITVGGACQRGPRANDSLTSGGDGAEAARFPHAAHALTRCVECHDPAAIAAGQPARPGADDHAPCDREACHRQDFLAPPARLCTLCHDEVDPTGMAPTSLAPYPPRAGRRALAAEFSHALHLDHARLEQSVGFHVACRDCHASAGAGRRGLPDHSACARCHADEAAPAGAPRMADCERCHVPRAPAPARERRLITGDLHFDHARHETDRTGQPTLCIECHAAVGAVARLGEHVVPLTAACVECHDDDARTPPALAMRACETCHVARSESFGTLAPRSHFPPRAIPEDHTLAFRSDHEVEAKSEGQRCARCHRTMSGSPRDTCDQCHRVMRPRDHTVGWREFDHGPAAGGDHERCATCHVADFCIACHSRPPRSHFPLGEFARGDHAALAELDLRACTVCHSIERDCTRLGCHDRGLDP
jgi:hypothetical protein